MPLLNLYHAKTHLSELVERAARGEEIVIAKAGRPRARLVQLAWPARSRQPAARKQEIWVADDFDSPVEAAGLSRPVPPEDKLHPTRPPDTAVPVQPATADPRLPQRPRLRSRQR